MLKVKNMNKSFINQSDETVILMNVNLDIDHGDWYSIIGPSGTGKTTFLKCISGLLKPDGGEVLYEDSNIYKLSEQGRCNFRRTTIGFVFQDFKLLPYYSVLDNVCLPLIHDKPIKELHKKAEILLDKVGISKNLFSRLPEGLSGGEKQRVAIARALIGDPAILVCDEPTGNLDTENRNRIVQLLSNLKMDGQTIIVVTHDHDVANQSDYILELKNGSLHAVEVAR